MRRNRKYGTKHWLCSAQAKEEAGLLAPDLACSTFLNSNLGKDSMDLKSAQRVSYFFLYSVILGKCTSCNTLLELSWHTNVGRIVSLVCAAYLVVHILCKIPTSRKLRLAIVWGFSGKGMVIWSCQSHHIDNWQLIRFNRHHNIEEDIFYTADISVLLYK